LGQKNGISKRIREGPYKSWSRKRRFTSIQSLKERKDSLMNIKTITDMAKEHAPEILTGINIVSTVGAVLCTANATPKALAIIEEEEYRSLFPLSFKDKVKLTWKEWVPTAICLATSVGTSIGSTAIGVHRTAEAVTSLALTQQIAEVYKSKVIDKIGAEEERTVRDEANAEVVPRLIPGDVGVIETGDGQELILDAWSGVLFRSSEEALCLAYAKFLELLNGDIDTFWCVNELRDLQHLPQIGGGNIAGWTSMYKPEIRFDWDSERQVYKIMTYENPPLPEFRLRGGSR
jgi:hypothetical protein